MQSGVSNPISLKGCAELISDYFFYAVNSILYQRGIYPEASFKMNTKYDLSVLVTTDENLTKYLTTILEQIRHWIELGAVKKLVLVIKSAKTEEVLERWQFNISTENNDSSDIKSSKSISQIQDEIRSVIRQIVASNTFLPILNTSCTFDLIVYTDRNTEIPTGWDETGPHFITNSAEMKLRSISTSIHRIDHVISFKRVS